MQPVALLKIDLPGGGPLEIDGGIAWKIFDDTGYDVFMTVVCYDAFSYDSLGLSEKFLCRGFCEDDRI